MSDAYVPIRECDLALSSEQASEHAYVRACVRARTSQVLTGVELENLARTKHLNNYAPLGK